MKRRSGAFASVLLLLLLLLNVSQLLPGVDAVKFQWSKAEGKRYANHEPVEIVVNKVGPFNNPTETYRYYSLPFCEKHATMQEEEAAAQEGNISINARALEGNSRVGAIKHRQQGLGESIAGDRRETSPFDITFNDSFKWRLLCKKTLSPEDLKKLKDAIHNNYFFEMFAEDLPMWGYIGDVQDENIVVGGEVERSHTYLFPHVHFVLETNDHQIVVARVTTDMDRKVDITEVDEAMHDVQFSYSVEFRPSEFKWRDRMTRYANSRLFPIYFDVHWFSIFNSLAIVLGLTALLGIHLVKMMKNDFYRSVSLNDDDGDAAAAIDGNESGQNKVIHGDIFRFPENAAIFCAAVGTGNQLFVLTLIELGLALCGVVSVTRRGSILVGVIILYCLTSIVGGYTAVWLYRQLNRTNWESCALATACLFPGPVAAVFIWVNTVATAHGSTSAVPLTAILTVSALYLFVSFPLTLAGGLLAKNYASADFYASAPIRTNKNPTDVRVIPPMILVLTGRLAAVLPFSAIYIELHYVFASMWGHQIYTLWGVLLLNFILLVIIASFFSMALLFFELRQDDFRGWWATFINGGMTGLFIYIYSCYYYFNRSGMSGILQGSFYFGYMAVTSFAFFLMLGSIGFQFSLAVVKYTYSQGSSSSSMKEPLITSN